jgi:tetratricopeptide (TPR) repeat protein
MLTVGLCMSGMLSARTDEPKTQPNTTLPPYKRLLTGSDAKKAANLERRADKAKNAQNYNKVIGLREELLALRAKTQGIDHWETIDAKWELDAARKMAALPAKQRADFQKARQKDDKADQFDKEGQYAKVQPAREAYCRWCERVFGEKHPITASSYNNLAANCAELGKFADAERLFQKALEIDSELLGDKHPDTANAYNNLAYIFNLQGRYSDAQPLYEKALDLYREVLGENHSDTATCYGSLASNLDHLGKYAEAQPLHQTALEVHRKLLGDNHPHTASLYQGLAKNLSDQGKYADAQPLFQKALDIYREQFGEQHPDTAGSYNEFAASLLDEGKYAEAQPLFQKALDSFRTVYGDNHQNTANSYNNVALILDARYKFEEAQPLLRKALEIKRALLGDKHPDTAKGYCNLAGNLFEQGKYIDAQPFFEKALKINRELLGDKHPHIAISCTSFALNSFAQHKYIEASILLTQATTAYETSRLGVAERGLDRAVYAAKRSPYRLLAVAHAHLSSPVAAWVAAETDLARGLSDEIASYKGLALTPDEQQLRISLTKRLKQIQPRLLQLVSTANPTDPDKDELVRLHDERRMIEAKLSDLASSLSQREVLALPTVQAAIPADAAVVLWVDVNLSRFQEHWGCVVRQTGEPAWERLSGTGPNQSWTSNDLSLPRKLREALSSVTTPTAELDLLAKRLHAQRLAPLARHLSGVKILYVIAVNEMAAIPIEALTGEYTIGYVPSGTFLARLQTRPSPSGSTLLALGDPVFTRPDAMPASFAALPPGGLLIQQMTPEGPAAKALLKPGDVLIRYGETDLTTVESLTGAIQAQTTAKEVAITVWREGVDKPFTRMVPPGQLGVVFLKEPARQALANRRKNDAMLLALRGGDWKDLPGTRSEVAQIAKLFGPTSTTLLDSEASEQSLDALRKKGELSKFRYLHFATHGEANNVRTLESVLILAQDKFSETPLPRVGEPLINGQLSAREVLEFWELNAELVTLSACETAIGRSGGGDGLLGFAQAFLTRGSRAVCLSLWKVDDTATALLMIRFYQNLLGKRDLLTAPMPKALALAEAKRWLRELPAEDALKLTAEVSNGVVRGTRGKGEKLKLPMPVTDPKQPGAKEVKPFADPRYWAAFILIGDPN